MVTDGWMDRLMDQWTDTPTDGLTMFLSHTDAMDISENNDFPTDFVFFTKALPTDQWMEQQTNRPTDQWTNGQTYPLIEMR